MKFSHRQSTSTISCRSSASCSALCHPMRLHRALQIVCSHRASLVRSRVTVCCFFFPHADFILSLPRSHPTPHGYEARGRFYKEWTRLCRPQAWSKEVWRYIIPPVLTFMPRRSSLETQNVLPFPRRQAKR
jgi:hypothetical protein